MTDFLKVALALLGTHVEVFIDRPLGSLHPRLGYPYPVNYGELPSIIAPDGAGLDAYLLGIDYPVKHGSGLVIAVRERYEDDDPKLLIWSDVSDINASAVITSSDEDMMRAIQFQEQWFDGKLHRLPTQTHVPRLDV